MTKTPLKKYHRQVLRRFITLVVLTRSGILGLPEASASTAIVITPAGNPTLAEGSTVQFSANIPVTWSLAPGSAGSINSSTGL